MSWSNVILRRRYFSDFLFVKNNVLHRCSILHIADHEGFTAINTGTYLLLVYSGTQFLAQSVPRLVLNDT